MTRLLGRSMGGCILMVACALASVGAKAQPVDAAPTRRTLDDAAKDNCESVSVVIQRCAQKAAPAPAAAPGDDALAKSRAAAKAAFDRRDQRASDEALQKPSTQDAAASANDAQQLGGVTVTGNTAAEPPSPEQALQRALAPPPPVAAPTVVHYAPNGTRYECIEKCFGPACCTELRSIPNPARDLNSIGR